MRRTLALVALLALTLAACGPAADEPVTTTVGSETSSTTAVTSTDPSSDAPTTSTAPESTTTDSGRPAAPDFTLELGDGGSYTLSEGAKPVYLVFWAEW